MKDTTGNLFYAFIFLLVSIPGILRAQASREGNHCAVAKSPYRLSMDSGKIVYSKECISCHQADGMGVTGNYPSLKTKTISGDKKKLIQILIVEHASAEENKLDSSRYAVPKNPR
jgi:mono/diheme cytochrome c family protein